MKKRILPFCLILLSIFACSTDDHQACAVPITRQDIRDLRDQGANRINTSYPGVFTPEAPYEIDAAPYRGIRHGPAGAVEGFSGRSSR